MKIALISCSKSKQNFSCAAAEMYAPSNLFSLSYKYAKCVAEKVLILSAKYGVLEENSVISPYNLTLNELTVEYRMKWAANVINQLKSKCDIDNDEFVILAGKKYYDLLIPKLNHYTIPVENLPLGSRMAFLKMQLDGYDFVGCKTIHDYASDHCDELHRYFNNMRRYTASEIAEIPFDNGIYIVFEKGEDYKGWQRIVRVGTHTSQNRLRTRLIDHFIRENKDGSIFRKNIGKAILNKEKNSYLSIWTLDTSKPDNRQYVNIPLQRTVEKKVSKYLTENMSFVVFPVADKQQRLRIEEAIISTLNRDDRFMASNNWLGNYSPEAKIRNSGLWLKDGLNASPLTDEELSYVRFCIEGKGISSSSLSAFSDSKHVDASKSARTPHISKQRKTSNTPGRAEIKEYIIGLFEQYRLEKKSFCVLTSGDIHRSLRLANKMPSVCGVMYRLIRPGDEILHTTPSGKSSTIKIKYYI